MKSYSIHEVARLLGCSPRTVARLISSGELEGFKLRSAPNSALRVTAEALERFIKRRVIEFQLSNGVGEDFLTEADKSRQVSWKEE
jgi:excisionase family DNA binding protein